MFNIIKESVDTFKETIGSYVSGEAYDDKKNNQWNNIKKEHLNSDDEEINYFKRKTVLNISKIIMEIAEDKYCYEDHQSELDKLDIKLKTKGIVFDRDDIYSLFQNMVEAYILDYFEKCYVPVINKYLQD